MKMQFVQGVPNQTTVGTMQQLCRKCGIIVTANLSYEWSNYQLIEDKSVCLTCGTILWLWTFSTVALLEVKTLKSKVQLRLF